MQGSKPKLDESAGTKHIFKPFFFLKKLKWNIIPTQYVLPSTRCVKEKQKSLYTIYKPGKEKTTKRKAKEITTICSPTLRGD